MSAIEVLTARARSAAKTIVLPEGQDYRVVVAANKAIREGIAKKIIARLDMTGKSR